MWNAISSGIYSEDGGLKPVVKVVGGAVCVGVAGYATYKVFFSEKTAQRSEKPQPLPPDDGPETPLAAALRCKEEGNKMFKAKRYEEAKKLYTDAITKCPADEARSLAIFFQNRAAACDSLQQWEAVVADCTEAIKLDNQYQKAYSRRGKAYLALKKHAEAVQDTATGYYLQDKKNKQNFELFMQAVSETAQVKCQAILKTRSAPIPCGRESVKAYLDNSPCDPVLNSLHTLAQLQDGQQTRSPFQEACAKMVNLEIEGTAQLLEEELSREDSPYIAEARLLRATVYAIGGCMEQAKEDLDKLIAMENISPRMLSTAHLRRGLLQVTELSESSKGVQDLSKACTIDDSNADVFHHRGQIALLAQEFQQAEQELEKAIDLYEKVLQKEQPNVLMHKLACDLQTGKKDPETIVEGMKDLCNKHPRHGDLWLLYGQTLIFFRKHAEAEAAYIKGIEFNPDNPRIYIQRASLMLSWLQDAGKAMEYLNKAKQIDPACETLYESMGALQLQQGNVEEALKSYSKHLEFARAAMDCHQTLSMIEAIKAQLFMKEQFGLTVPNVMFQMAL